MFRPAMTALPLALASLFGFAAPAAAQCQFAKVGDLKVDGRNGPPMVEITVNGRTGKLLVDTGAFATILTPAGIEALGGVPGEDLQGMRVVGGSGEVRATLTTLKDIQLGGALRIKQLKVLVTPGGYAPESGVVGILGLDVLGASDVEFDLAHDRISLFTAKGCGKDVSLAYWGGAPTYAPLKRDAETNKLATTVTLNGRDISATIDSGNAVTLVNQPAAGRLGVTPTSPGSQALPAGEGRLRWVGGFQSFAWGDEEIKNPKIVVADLYSGMTFKTVGSLLPQSLINMPDVILGLDFLRSHRMLISNAQGRVYFSYVGGKVFAQPAAVSPR